MNLDQFTQIFPKLQFNRAKEIFPYIDAAMNEYEINTLQRQAAFIAQIGHETGGFKWLEELASGAEYEGRKDLGNTESGDGKRYKGRGAIMITGRYNYKIYGAKLGIDLVNHPDMASDLTVCFRIAGQFWKDHGLNALADAGDMEHVTKRINGGLNGFNSRMAYYEAAIKILGGEPAHE